MLNRLYLFSNKTMHHRYAANSARHLALQQELNSALQCFREINNKEKSLKTTIGVIQKFGEESDDHQFFVKPGIRSQYAKSIEAEKLSSIEKTLSILNEIIKECAETIVPTPTPIPKK